MTSVRSKILEFFGNIKSDAVPRPPRPTGQENHEEEVFEAHNENVKPTNGDDEREEIFIESDDIKGKNKKPKKPFFKSKKKDSLSDSEKDDRRNSNSSVNTQATGNVFNIVNSKDVRCGNDYVYYMGPTNTQHQPKDYYPEEHIEKSNLIILVMEADKKMTVENDREYIDYISKNLGRNWHSIFRAMGYSKGKIETVEMEQGNITEARYTLLMDWVRNEDDNSLGRLTTLLWDEGERSLVKELAVIYKKNKK